jgi:small subunit ribosomal protein S1
LIFSERAAADDLRKEESKEKAKLLQTFSEGEVRQGRVTSLADFGAFVDIGGIDGLIHLSELSWTHVTHPGEVVKVGDKVDVYILNIEHEQLRVALSLKRLQPEPWSQVFDYYQIDQIVDAVITKLTNFGAFARIDNRIEGLIHISEISAKNISHPKEVVSENQKVKVRIIHIDPERKRMGLSMKQVEDLENWQEFQHGETAKEDATPETGEDEAVEE